MPARMVRSGLITSDRTEAIGDAAFRLFVGLLLTADDLGNAEATPGAVGRLVRHRGRPLLEPAGADALMAELAAVDLVRPFVVDGKRYAHIPRYGQRLRSYKRTNPRPPADIECNQIKELMQDLTDNGGQMSAVDGLKGKGKGKLKGFRFSEGEEVIAARETPPVDNSAAAAVRLPGGWWRTDRGIEAAGLACGIPAQRGDTYAQWKARIFEARGKA